jgi:hypothetical protein
MYTKGIKVGGSQEDTAKVMLHYVANTIWQCGYQPSVREIVDYMGWSSLNYATHLLRAYFHNHTDEGEGYVGSRAISFNWRQFVTDPTFPRNERKVPAVNPKRRVKAARKKGR